MDDVFTPEELAATDSKDLSFLLQSRGYTEFFVPLIVGLIQSSVNQLADPSLARKNSRPDDYLRGYIAASRAILNAPNAILAAQARQAQEEADQRTEQERYEEIARSGRGPIGEAEAPISPSDPI